MNKKCVEKQKDAYRQEEVWQKIKVEAKEQAKREPVLASFFHSTIINHPSLGEALSHILAHKLATPIISAVAMREMIEEAYKAAPCLIQYAAFDLFATVERDPAVDRYTVPLLYLKGFHALQGYRIANWLWRQGRTELALYLQNQISVVCQVDIHPAADIGYCIMLDHATGIVIGETAVIENDVSILQNVTLGGTGKECGVRHPKIRSGVLIGAGAKILGNIEIGEGAKIAAGSVVLHPIPAHRTAAGVPARVVGTPKSAKPSLDMDQKFYTSDGFIGGDGI